MSNTDLANKLEVNPDANKTPAVILIIFKSSKSLVDNRGKKIIYVKEKKSIMQEIQIFRNAQLVREDDCKYFCSNGFKHNSPNILSIKCRVHEPVDIVSKATIK